MFILRINDVTVEANVAAGYPARRSVEAGAIEVAAAALRAYPDDQNVQRCGAGMLQNLCLHYSLVGARAMAAGAEPLLEAAARAFPDDDWLQKVAATALMKARMAEIHAMDDAGRRARFADGKCMKGHALKRWRTPKDGYGCDVCRVFDMPQGTEVMHCSECGFDLCARCAPQLQLPNT